MKPAPFRYLTPQTEGELLAALGEYGGEARILAGGQSLVPMMNFRMATPSVLVDINGISSLDFVTQDADRIELGALTRHASLEDRTALHPRLQLLPDAIGHLAHRAVRNRGTLGGSLALAYPNAELPLLFVTLGASVRLRSPRGMRDIETSRFIAAPLQTVLAGDEFVHSVSFALPAAQAGSAFVEVGRRHGDFALAAAAAIVDLDAEGRVRAVSLGSSGGDGVPIRLEQAERELTGQRPEPAAADEICRAAVDAFEIEDDIHFPAGYRRLVLTTVLQRAFRAALARAEQRHVQ